MSLDQRDGKLRAFYHLPVKALTLVTLERFGRLLDPAKAFLNQYCLQPDWQGLAEQMGYTFDKIKSLQGGEKKTVILIKEFSEKINSTIGQLLDMIEKLGRYDVLEDEILEECIVRDVKNFEKHQKTNSVQHWKVNSSRSLSTNWTPELEHQITTVGEVQSGRTEYFDAIINYSVEDIEFVNNLRKRLEGELHLKLFIKERDLIVGTTEWSALIDVIERRCNTMILILSQNFLRCDLCDEMVKCALSCNANIKILPIIIRQPFEMPSYLKYYTCINYTRHILVPDFWNRIMHFFSQRKSPEELEQAGSDVSNSPVSAALDSSTPAASPAVDDVTDSRTVECGSPAAYGSAPTRTIKETFPFKRKKHNIGNIFSKLKRRFRHKTKRK